MPYNWSEFSRIFADTGIRSDIRPARGVLDIDLTDLCSVGMEPRSNRAQFSKGTSYGAWGETEGNQYKSVLCLLSVIGIICLDPVRWVDNLVELFNLRKVTATMSCLWQAIINIFNGKTKIFGWIFGKRGELLGIFPD